MRRSILVIKLSALGDLFFALPALQAIRRHHPDERLVLLTAARFEALMRSTGLFDEVWADERPGWGRPLALLRLARRLRRPRFARVYDLQWSNRSDLYLRLIGRSAEERIGATPAATLRYPDRRARKPIRERQADLLRLAGLPPVAPPDLAFLATDVERFGLAGRTALLVPGSAPTRPLKRWPAERYAALAQGLAAAGLRPVLIGGEDERAVLQTIQAAEPTAFAAPMTLGEIATLARAAAVTVGNDTGPAHLAALAGSPIVMLFGEDSDPVKQRPFGQAVRVLERRPLSDLPVDEVLAAALALARPAGA